MLASAVLDEGRAKALVDAVDRLDEIDDVTEIVPLLVFAVFLALAVIVVAGPVVSTLNERTAGVGSASPPVIARTAKAMKGDREKSIEAGASDYITKPVDTDQLLSLMRVWLYQ